MTGDGYDEKSLRYVTESNEWEEDDLDLRFELGCSDWI